MEIQAAIIALRKIKEAGRHYNGFKNPLMLTSEFKKDDYKPPKKSIFEDIEANIPNDDYNTLTPIYGDYMQLPPVEKRISHPHFYVDLNRRLTIPDILAQQ